jgi:hypothetical protein
MALTRVLKNLVRSGPVFRSALESRNVRVLSSLLGPAWRGLVRRHLTASAAAGSDVAVDYEGHFDWRYSRGFPEMARLYEVAKASQWDAARDVDWSVAVDPYDPSVMLVPDDFVPASALPTWGRLTARERAVQRHMMLTWLLSQFLHGEQGALFAAAQVTEAVPWTDGKLYGSTQVVDEGRHVEVFHTYLTRKLEHLYEVNDSLYIVIDALMSDPRWDVKFLGMQIMVEGLALGAFGSIRRITGEPLLKDILKRVITDEARHVRYGVLALREAYAGLGARERRDREDWTFEVLLLLRNRFLAHEFYDEFYAHQLSRRAWDELVLGSRLMSMYRDTMFRRIVPNLKRIGLLSDRVRPRYAELGLLVYEDEPAATELTAADLLTES